MANTIGSLIIDVAGTALTAEEKEILAHPLVGGVILFSRHYENRHQLQQLCQSIREARKKPLLILADQEGGRVQRFQSEFTPLPPMATFGTLYERDPEKALILTQQCGYIMASELLACGLDLSLAPILDLNRGFNTVIGDRAFHHDPHIVIALAQALMNGMQQAGMAAVGKHFPGHGGVSADSHLALPIDSRTQTALMTDIEPFAVLAKQHLPAIMAAHIVFPAIDARPATYSTRWLRDILRKELKFTGAILSDDLNMEGANLSSHYGDRIAAAREAGCDFTLLCNNPNGVIQALDCLPSAAFQVEENHWRALQGHPQKPVDEKPMKHFQNFLHEIMNEV